MAGAAPFRRRRDKAGRAHDHSSSDTAARATLRRERALEPIDECARESEARRRRGRGRVANVHETSRDIEGEVVDEPSVGVECLGPNAGWSRKEVARAKGGHVAAQRREEERLQIVARELRGAGAPVANGEAREGAVAERRDDVGQPHVGPPVALARERENGVGAEQDGAVDPAGEVHAQEREARIGDRIHETAEERPPLGPKDVVVAAERNDLRIRSGAGLARQHVRVEAGARDRRSRDDRAGGGPDPDLVLADRQADDRGLEPDLDAEGGDLPSDRQGDLRVVDDPRFGHPQTASAADRRLDRLQAAGVEELDAGQAVRPTALAQLRELAALVLARRHDELAAELDRDPAVLAVVDEELPSLDAEARLRRARRVVQARMDDAAVVPGLMTRYGGLFLEHQHAPRWVAQYELARRRQTEDPRADDDHVERRRGADRHPARNVRASRSSPSASSRPCRERRPSPPRRRRAARSTRRRPRRARAAAPCRPPGPAYG